MKKLSRIKLQNALVLEEQEMKRIYGGSGSGGDYGLCGGSGYTHVCECTGQTAVWCGYYQGGAETSAITRHCGEGNGACRPFRN